MADRASVSHITDDMVDRVEQAWPKVWLGDDLDWRGKIRGLLSAALAGCTVVGTPKPAEVDAEGVGYWGDGRTPEFVSSRPPNGDPGDRLHGVNVAGLIRHGCLAPKRAREVASWLLAAADHADLLAGAVSLKGDDTK